MPAPGSEPPTLPSGPTASVTLKNNEMTTGLGMSSKKNNAPMPASSAGLLTFFNEETQGVKIRPEIVLISSIVLIAASIAVNIFLR